MHGFNFHLPYLCYVQPMPGNHRVFIGAVIIEVHSSLLMGIPVSLLPTFTCHCNSIIISVKAVETRKGWRRPGRGGDGRGVVVDPWMWWTIGCGTEWSLLTVFSLATFFGWFLANSKDLTNGNRST